jgi:site-specific DNA-methyltransferase (adenine-specific)
MREIGRPELGTALKPAWEPIILARKPLAGTVAACVLKHGTGALNIDATRIGTDGGTASTGEPNRKNQVYGDGMGGLPSVPLLAGRWPANVLLDEDAARMLDEQSGESVSPTSRERTPDGPAQATWSLGSTGGVQVGHGDSGGASRFFYTAKASRSDRDEELLRDGGTGALRDGGTGALRDGGRTEPRGNHHPTVKPTDLMRWLCRLVTPPGGLILDPFAGSGSTGVAAVAEGFRFIGIEQDAEYVAIAKRRIANVAPLFDDDSEFRTAIRTH